MAVFDITFFSTSLDRTVPLKVILPTDKFYFPGMPRREEGKPYKSLYLLHGILGSCIDWVNGTRIQRWAEEKDLAVIMPSGENAMYLDNALGNYGTLVGEEIVNFTRKTFPLSHKKEDTYIGGLSMGGFGAMRNGLKYRDTFGAIISLSGAFVLDESVLVPVANPKYPSDTFEYRKKVYGEDLEGALVSDKNPEWTIKYMAENGIDFPDIFMAIGEDDFLKPTNERIHKLLEKYNVRHEFIVAPGSHEWDFWDTHIKKALDWLPLEDAIQGKSSGNIAE